MTRIALAVLGAAAVLLAAATASAGVELFRTPSGNIGCAYLDGDLRCDIRSGLNPRPPRPPGCELDWGFGLSLGRTGRAKVACAGDTVLDPRARVLRYGSAWRREGFRCISRRSGLTCTNPQGRGFFLSRQEWRRV